MNVYLPPWSGLGLIDVTLKALLVVALAENRIHARAAESLCGAHE